MDDNESIRTFLAPFFNLADLPVEIIEFPQFALERFKARPDACSMLLTDCEMPGMNGLEPAKRIRRERADLPMIIFSTSVTVLGPAKFLSAGFSAALSKPVALAKLRSTSREGWASLHRQLARRRLKKSAPQLQPSASCLQFVRNAD